MCVQTEKARQMWGEKDKEEIRVDEREKKREEREEEEKGKKSKEERERR